MPKKQTDQADRYCTVCGEKIKVHECIHYGALSCYSCRAFFRRYNQNSRLESSREIRCSRSEASMKPCEINTETRKSCQRCRYDKCIASGMRPELVLSVEERVRRFRHLHQGEGRQTTQGQASGLGDSSGIPQQANETLEHVASTKLSFSPRKTRNQESRNAEEGSIGGSVEDSKTDIPKQQLRHMKELEEIQKAYDLSSRRILDSSQGKQFVSKLLALHCGTDVASHNDILHLFANIHSLIYKSFAGALRGFKSVHPSDQERLLRRNAQLHLIYILSGFLTANSGWNQFRWLTDGATMASHLSKSEGRSLPHFAPNKFLQGSSGYTDIVRLCNAINELLRLLQIDTKKSVLAIALLFSQDSLILDNSTTVQHEYRRYLRVIRFGLNINISVLERLLMNLSSLFNRFGEIHGPLCYDIAIRGTPALLTDDESMMQHQLRKFDHVFHSVPYGSNLVERVLGAMATGHWDPLVIKQTVSVQAERALRLLRTHAEFNGLGGNAQNDMFRSGAMRLQALLNMRSVDAQSPAEQLQCVIGYQDMEYLQTVKKGVQSPAKRVDLEATRSLLSEIAHPTLVEQYLDLHIKLKPLLSRHEMFQLLALVCLFTPCSNNGSSTPFPQSLKMVGQRYLVMVEKRNSLNSSSMLKIVDEIDQMADLYYLLLN